LACEVQSNQIALGQLAVFDSIQNPIVGEALRASRGLTSDTAWVNRVFKTSARDKLETDFDVLTPRARRLTRTYYDLLAAQRRENARWVPSLAASIPSKGFIATGVLYTQLVEDSNNYTRVIGDSLLQEYGGKALSLE